MNMIILQIELLVFLIIGWVFGKKQWISKSTAKQLNFLVMNLILPCSIFHAFQTELTQELLRSSVSILILAILIQFVTIFLGKILWKKYEPSKRINLDYATAACNAGTLGMIVGEAAFGNEGLLFTSIYAIPLRISMWGYGITIYSKQAGSSKGLLKKVLTNPCIIAIELGIIAMIFQTKGYPLPVVITQTVSALGSCNSVLIMLTIRATLSELPIKEMIETSVLNYSFVRLILLPGTLCLLLWILHIKGMPLKISVLETAMPAPMTMAMLAQQYHKNEQYAGKLVFLSTVLSMFTLPLWTMVLNALF